MTPESIARLAALMALQAEMYSNVAYMEGMIVANKMRESEGLAMAYDDDSFAYVTNCLAELGKKMTEV